MTVVQTLLVFVAIPAGIISVIFLGVYGKSMMRQPNRYRPGRSWDYPPSWYVPHPEVSGSGATSTGGRTTAVGGASGEW